MNTFLNLFRMSAHNQLGDIRLIDIFATPHQHLSSSSSSSSSSTTSSSSSASLKLSHFVQHFSSPVNFLLRSDVDSPALTPTIEYSATFNCHALVQSPFRKYSFKRERRQLYRSLIEDSRNSSIITNATTPSTLSPTSTSSSSSPQTPPLTTTLGGFGSVFIGSYDGRIAAIKQFHHRVLNNSTKCSALLSELSTFRLPVHQNIAKILAFTSCGRTIQLVHEYVGRRNLQSLLCDDDEPFDSDRRHLVICQIAEALRFCHEHRILHLDVKPANVLVFDTRLIHCKLADFGCSERADETLTSTRNPTSKLFGTVMYKAPELLMCERATDKADVYSLGLLMWQCFSRESPFAAYHPHTAIFLIVSRCLRPDCRHLISSPSMVSSNNGRLSIDRLLIDIMQQCWHALPSARPNCQSICNILLSTISTPEAVDQLSRHIFF